MQYRGFNTINDNSPQHGQCADASLLGRQRCYTCSFHRCAASIQPYTPSIPSAPSPEAGYLIENTPTTIEVYDLAVNGQYPSQSSAISAYLTVPGSNIKTVVQVQRCQLATTADGTRMNSITLLMPSYTSAVTATVTVQLTAAQSVVAATSFTYYELPKEAPQLQANPTVGPITRRTKVLIELQSVIVCKTTSDVVVQFEDAVLGNYTWEVGAMSSTMTKTTLEVFSPLIAQADYAYVYMHQCRKNPASQRLIHIIKQSPWKLSMRANGCKHARLFN